jgi:hypothetical protein
MVGILTGVSAAAFARTVAAMSNAPAALREETSRMIRECCDGTSHPYRVEHAGTIVNTPPVEEVRELNAALTAR